MTPTPAEQHRLRALDRLGVMHTAPEAAFDRLVGLIASRFGTAAALINFVDEHEAWPKAQVGLPDGAGAMPRDSALCGRLIEDGETLVCPDTRAEAALQGHPLFGAGGAYRFYAGTPVCTRGGERVGTVCVLDPSPRAFSAQDRRDLEGFAALVSQELDLRVARRAQQDLVDVLQGAQHAIVTVDAAGEVTFMNAAARALLGEPATGADGREPANLDALLEPLACAGERAACLDALRAGRPWQGSAAREQGGQRQVLELTLTPAFRRAAGAGDAAEAGALLVLRDVTHERQDERLRALLMNHADETLALHAPDGRLLHSNRGYLQAWSERQAGEGTAGEAGADHLALIHPDDRERVLRDSLAPALRGEKVTIQWRRAPETAELGRAGPDQTGLGEPGPHSPADGQPVRWMESSTVPVVGAGGDVDYLLVISRDITERRARDEELLLLRSAVVAAGEAVVILRADAPRLPPGAAASASDRLTVVFVNDAFCRMTGYAAGELLGHTPRALVGEGTDAATLQRLTRALRGWEPVEDTVQFRNAAGRALWLRVTLSPVADADGTPTHWVAVLRDITAWRLEQGFEDARRRVLEAVAAAAPLPDVLQGLTHMLEARWPEAMASLLLLQDHRLHEAVPSRLPPEYREAVDGVRIGPAVGACGSAAYSGEAVACPDLWTDPRWETFAALVRRHGLRACWSVPVLSGNRSVLGTLALYHAGVASPTARELEVMEDTARLAAVVLERYRALDDKQHLALYDTLTELPNRTLFNERLGTALGRRAPGQHLAVGLLDLDRFRTVNDSVGHAEADRLLAAVARRLERALQRFGGVLARMGGDEFTFLIEGLDDPASAQDAAQAIMRGLRAPFAVGGQELVVSASVGLALCPGDGQTGAELLRLAETAMYHAKQGAMGWASGGGTPQASARRQMQLETALHHALEGQELEVHYQPIVGGAQEAGRVVEIEALARWHSPTLGAVSPGEFIPMAERTGQIIAIGAWVLRRACTDAARWQAAAPGLRVAVNVSLKQFNHPAFLGLLEATLRDTGLRPELLTLEITESVLMDQAEAILRIEHLRALGVRLAIDDFGSGYSSLKYLRELPVQAVKIDRTFVQSMTEPGGRDVQIVRSVAGLCRGLGMDVTAEGIETPAQAELARELGIDALQGWLYGRPMPLPALLAWLRGAREVPA